MYTVISDKFQYSVFFFPFSRIYLFSLLLIHILLFLSFFVFPSLPLSVLPCFQIMSRMIWETPSTWTSMVLSTLSLTCWSCCSRLSSTLVCVPSSRWASSRPHTTHTIRSCRCLPVSPSKSWSMMARQLHTTTSSLPPSEWWGCLGADPWPFAKWNCA